MASCAGCDEEWGGVATAHCSVCHRTFSAVSGFDLHRFRGSCMEPTSRGLVWDDGSDRRPYGFWKADQPYRDGAHDSRPLVAP